MEKYMFGISIDEALAKSQERLAEYTKNILEESDSFHAVEITKLKEVIETLKAENARLREALERIDNECSRDDTIAWKIANDALEELK
jgi:transcription initiation factor IIE alpha subunit